MNFASMRTPIAGDSSMRARRYLLTCYRYIELNPVRADMAGDPGEYRWSSYRWHGLGERNEVVTEHPLYLALGASEEDRRAAYRALFRAHLEEEALDEIRKAANRGLPLGNDRFREQVEAVLGRRMGLRLCGRREGEAGTRLPFMKSRRWRESERGPNTGNDTEWRMAA